MDIKFKVEVQEVDWSQADTVCVIEYERWYIKKQEQSND